LNDRLIFGVDIASRSPHSRRPPTYALFALAGENASAYSAIGRQKLIRLIRRERPDLVAVDNVYELAAGRAGLVSLMRLLPANTRLVQVTGGERAEPLTRVARWHGLTFDRSSPVEEAEACARLAASGVGAVLSAFEDRTWIKVSRRRSPGRGGWSQNRYSRKIHGNVKGLAREVEKQLKEAHLEYSWRAVEGLGGYIRAEFTVEAPRDKVPVKPGLREDAQIRVEAMARPRLEFTPLESRRNYLIIGMDPGTTTGLAALNLRGELVDLTSGREISPSDAIEWIAERGKPLIVATDVFPTPGAVEKVKRAFNAVLFSPGEALAAEEKILLARPYGYRNDHERDALAAAASAFKRYRNKFHQVERKAAGADPEEVKAQVVRGLSIDRALAELSSPQPLPPQHTPEQAAPPLQARKEQTRLLEQIKNLRSYLDDLKSELADRDRRLADMAARIERLKDRSFREMKREREIRIRDKEIERLRVLLRSERRKTRRLSAQRAQARQVRKVEEMAGYRRLKPVSAFSRESVVAAAERWSIGQNDLVLLENSAGGGTKAAELLASLGVEAIVARGEMAEPSMEFLESHAIPVLKEDEISVRRLDGIAFIDPDELKAAKEAWAERRRALEAERKSQWLESMVQEYRAERRREERLEERRRAERKKA